MSAKKNALGRGLGALLQNVEVAEGLENTAVQDQDQRSSVTASISFIPISEIQANPYQPRKEFDEESLLELAESIRHQGIITPITIRKLAAKQYQLIAGERRYRAAQLVGLTDLPAYIRVATDTEVLEMALVENIQRENLNAMEVALSYQALIDDCQITQEKLSERVGKNRSTITNYLRLLKLPAEVQIALGEEKISMAHARCLVSIDEPQMQLSVLRRIVEEELSVRQVEDLARKITSGKTKKTVQKDSLPQTHIEVQNVLTDRLNTSISLKRSRKGKGVITIEFANDADFDRIVKLLE